MEQCKGRNHKGWTVDSPSQGRFAHGDFTKMIESDLPFSANTAQRLMKIGMDGKLANPAHAQHLPNSWSTLHELTKLDSNKFYEGIGTGKIRPDMTRKDAIAFRVGDLEGKNSKNIAFPQNKYSILLADPPWFYNSQKQFGGDHRATNGASSYYGTVKTEDLMEWDIPSLCEDDCLLFCTGPEYGHLLARHSTPP